MTSNRRAYVMNEQTISYLRLNGRDKCYNCGLKLEVGMKVSSRRAKNRVNVRCEKCSKRAGFL